MATEMTSKTWADYVTTDPTATEYVRALVIGPSGMGKTRFCATTPQDQFWINTDKGLTTLAQVGITNPWRIDLERETDVSKIVLQILRALKNGEGPFAERKPKTLILDGLTALAAFMDTEFGGGSRAMTLPEYNIHKMRFMNILNLLQDLPCHVFCTALVEYMEEEATKRLEEYAAVTGQKMGPRLPAFFDEVYYMGYEEDKKEGGGTWYLTCAPTNRFKNGKSRIMSGRPKIENPTWGKVERLMAKARATVSNDNE